MFPPTPEYALPPLPLPESISYLSTRGGPRAYPLEPLASEGGATGSLATVTGIAGRDAERADTAAESALVVGRAVASAHSRASRTGVRRATIAPLAHRHGSRSDEGDERDESEGSDRAAHLDSSD